VNERKPNEDELAEVYREGIRRGTWPDAGCPSGAELERLALGEAGAAERVRLADHLVECAQCAATVRDLRSLAGWAERAERAAGERRTGTGTAGTRRWLLPLAAALAVALGGAVLWTQWVEPPPDTDAVRGVEAAVTPAPGAELARFPDRFDWPDQRGATGYRVRLLDAGGEVVWESAWRSESWCPAPEMPGAGDGERGYLWTVEVRGFVPRSRLGPYPFMLRE
jgi:hypothetical protein